jgi:putative ABC transport system permease protein
VTGPLYLGWRYLTRHRAKTVTLVGSVALILFLPIGLQVLVGEVSEQLSARAQATPLLVGARASALELVLSSLYFESAEPEATHWDEVERIRESGLADPIPLYVRFRVRDQPIVGTTLDYLDFRGLRVEDGRVMAVLGECVVGATAAQRLGVSPGDTVVSSPESVFDLAGVYPLELRVTGVLAPAHTPDDDAVFVDVKTAWVIAGLGHGHQDLAKPEADAAVLRREGRLIRANASVVQYNTITPENVDSFHFHGSEESLPVTGVIAVPHDEKSAVLLMGRYTGADEAVQITRPAAVMENLLATVAAIQSYVEAAIGAVAVATLATAALVFSLSMRLRRREVSTLSMIGASRGSVATLLFSEVAFVLIFAALLAGTLTLGVGRFAAPAIRALVLA